MVFEVELRAFRDGEIREVNVPEEVFNELETNNEVLEAVFKFGQNDFQPKNQPSVSMGDVIIIPSFKRRGGTIDRRFEVAMFGFKEVK